MGEGGREKERMRGEKSVSLKFVSHIGMYYLMSLNFSEKSYIIMMNGRNFRLNSYFNDKAAQ